MFAVALATLFVVGQPASPPSEAERLKDLAVYLRAAAKFLGKLPIEQERYPAKENVLWERASEIAERLGGRLIAQELAGPRTLGTLENATFKIMARMYGPKWYEEYLKNPVRAPEAAPQKSPDKNPAKPSEK